MSTAKELGERIKALAKEYRLPQSRWPTTVMAELNATIEKLVSMAPAEQAGVMREFVERVAKQKPEKPDYWSSCGQCQHNINDAEDLLAASPQPPATHPGWPCEIESADFEANTITVRMMTNDYRVAAGKHILIPAGIPKEGEHG